MVELQNKGLQMAYFSGWSSIIELQDGQVVSNALDVAFGNIDTALTDIDTKLNGAGYSHIILTPQATEPAALSEGMMYYDLVTHTFVAINDIDGTRLNFGYELNERCSNHTGDIILEAKVIAVSQVNVDSSFEIMLAKADLLETAVAFGVTTSEFAVGGIGAVTKIGRVNGIDTLGLAANAPLYLSDTEAGGITGTPPAIKTVIGYVVQAQTAPAEKNGVIYIDIRSAVALPNVVGFMNQDAATLAAPIDDTPVAVVDYSLDAGDSGSVISTISTPLGTINSPLGGIYEASVYFDISFTPTNDNVRHLSFDIVEDDGGAISTVATYSKEMHKNAEGSSASFNKTFTSKKNAVYHLEYRAGAGEDFADFILQSVSFSLKSINIG